MLIAVVVLLTILGWGGMLLVYYKGEIERWFDNRYGPERVTREEEQANHARKERRRSLLRWYD